MAKCKIFGVLLIFLLLVIVPVSFAFDNDTAIQIEDDMVDEIIESGADSTPLGIDYYFNSSSDVDGDGSQENPYNFINSNRLKTGSTIHLANGEYTLTSGKNVNNVEIIGENPEKTILRYTGTGNSGKFTLNIDNYLILKNVTLIGFNIDVEGATLQAENTIIKNAVAFPTTSSATDLVNSATNSFGGAIYAYSYQTSYGSSLPTVLLDNCTFINNTGEYGGAIYMNQGTLDVANSNFINNYAYNYGGAICSILQVSTRIKNTRFINDYSLNDAGGAIYLFKSSLSATNMTAINCSATFGGAITALNSTTALIYFDAINNTAKYEGGAVYQMYNGLSLTYSNFIANKARNGGALYADAVEIFKNSYNNFTNNEASDAAGAVYLMFNPKISENDRNNYTNNRARVHNDFYNQETLILRIGNGNYTLVVYNDTYDGNLPASYDLRDYNLVTPIKDQQSGGNCWAFASLAALESAILKASGKIVDLSEENMKNLMAIYSDYGWNMYETNDGGTDEMGISYLTSWIGPVDELDDKYDDYSMLSPVLNSIFHVQNIIYLERNSYSDNDAIKKAIMKYGAVSTGIYFDSVYFSTFRNSYYYYGSGYANHAVAIVGWDDSYSSSNFNYKPAGNGAWIVKNSWGTDWGDGGYFYVSYYDTILAQVGQPTFSHAIVLNDTVRFDKNYQYDINSPTDYFVTDEKNIWVENIFNATDNELLAAVSTYFRKAADWELFIYLNDELVYDKNGSSIPGYWTINLDKQIPIALGDTFKVKFRFSADSGAEFAICEKTRSNQLSYRPGVSFFSFDGLNWTDLYNYSYVTESDEGHTYNSQVASIKAFTILYDLKPSIELSISKVYNDIDISTIIHDQYGNLIRSGEVIFNIEDSNHTIKIENGKANFSYNFKNKGSYDVIAYYMNARNNQTVDIDKLNLDVALEINIDKNNAVIDFNTVYRINRTLNLTVNNETHFIKLIDGRSQINLNDLEYGYYNLNLKFFDEDYACDVNSGFNITISKTKIISDDLTVYYNSNEPYLFYLKDNRGNPVVNRQVSLIVNGKSYVANTDAKGEASVNLDFNKVTTYRITMMFFGDDDYLNSTAAATLTIKSTISIDSDVYFMNSNVNVKLFNSDGKSLVRGQVNLVINGVDYWLISDNEGMVCQNLNLKAGSYEIKVNNLETGEIITETIRVISPITQNKDMTVYYTSNSYFQVKVAGDGGSTVKMVVNGKTNNVKIDSKGIAKLKINWPAGTYTVKTTYNGVTVSNKVVVKPLLITKNVSKKKAKKIKFSAKLVNNKGKVQKGKKITFKIKGKTYKAKTNKKGVATISLKNLKKGKYTITSKFGKSKVKNTIKIR